MISSTFPNLFENASLASDLRNAIVASLLAYPLKRGHRSWYKTFGHIKMLVIGYFKAFTITDKIKTKKDGNI